MVLETETGDIHAASQLAYEEQSKICPFHVAALIWCEKAARIKLNDNDFDWCVDKVSNGQNRIHLLRQLVRSQLRFT
jgi:hypothetical protein